MPAKEHACAKSCAVGFSALPSSVLTLMIMSSSGTDSTARSLESFASFWK